MLPVIALVGRPNVGKSTLFNVITGTRDALVADYPGLTRDRQYGSGKVLERPFVVVDTGGLTGEKGELDGLMANQVQMAIDESDAILLMVDGRDGITASDEEIMSFLRRFGKPISLVVNKVDGINAETACADFYELGLEHIYGIAAAQSRGVKSLFESVLKDFPIEEEVEEE